MCFTRLRAFAVAIVVLAALIAGCGSSSKSSSDQGTKTAGPCPFSGSMQSQTNPGAGAAAATSLATITPSVNGCVDQLAFAFSPTLAASAVAYTPNQAQLVVTLTNTTYGGPATLPVGTLQYVKAITVSSKS